MMNILRPKCFFQDIQRQKFHTLLASRKKLKWTTHFVAQPYYKKKLFLFTEYMALPC